MAEGRQNTIVGLFVFVGLVVLVALVFMFGGGQTLFTQTYDINVHFPKGVVGVQPGQGVTLHGKRIGETARVEFVRDEEGNVQLEKGVNVIVAVEAKYDLPAATKVVVTTSIMGLGRPIIELVVVDPADATRLAHDGTAIVQGEQKSILDQVLPPQMQHTLEQATADIGRLASATTPVADNLARLLEARDVHDVDIERLTANLDTVIQRFDGALRNLNSILGDAQNQENFSTLLANARKMSDSGVDLMVNLTEISENGKMMMQEGVVLTRRLATAADDLSGALQEMDRTFTLMNEGQGTAAMLLRDGRLYEELVLTSKRMTAALDDFRAVLDMAKKGKLSLF